MTIAIFLMTATLLVCGVVAAWPILLSRWLRPAVQGAGGLFCILSGGTAFLAMAGGLTGNWNDRFAMAAETAASGLEVGNGAKSSDESAFFTAAASPSSAELNTPVIESTDEVKIIGDPPAWVGSLPVTTGEVHTIAVCSGPFATQAEVQRALDQELEKQTARYIEEQLDSKLAPQFIHYSADEIKQELVSSNNTYSDVVQSPTVGAMQRRHALLEFRPQFRERIHQQWNEVKSKWRLAQLGLVAGGAILLLSTVFGYFRADNATRGYYTGRLQFLSAAAILAIVGAGAIVAQWIHWL
jgi:hypothetical protein